MNRSVTASALLVGLSLSSPCSSAEEIGYYSCSDFVADATKMGAGDIAGAGPNAVFGYAFVSGGFFGATGILPAQSNPDLEKFVENLIAECMPKPSDSALAMGLQLARQNARSIVNQDASITVGIPVKMNGVTVTPYNIRPTHTLGGHKTRVVFSAINETESIVDIRVECSFYEGGVPADNGLTYVKSIPANGEVVGSVPSYVDATRASCRPAEVTKQGVGEDN